MRSKIGRLIFAVLIFLWTGSVSIYAQRPAETVAEVPALNAFHEVIYKIWHEAWPKKNTAMLQQLVSDVEKGISSVAASQLPGILRERKTAWDEGVKKLQSAGSEYKAAAAAKDDPKLLAVAEKLHGQFESLMRAIRPAMKELDEFHATLYMLYHHYLPQNEMARIKSTALDLKQKMAALNSAALPDRLKQKLQEFTAARADLSKSVDDLQTAIQSNAEKTIKGAVETLHTNYRKLEKIFE
jgi:predicted transcriptional regulator